MNISKISRSLVVVIFIALILFMGYEDIILMIGNATFNIFKIIYVIVAILLVILYVYIKDKLYKKKIKRNISLILRYAYILIIVIVMSILSVYSYINVSANLNIYMYILFKLSIGLILKKIIFNVSKSDILSVFGIFAFGMLPCFYINQTTLYVNLIGTLIMFISVLILQILIDELKQRGVKTKKYLILSVILGICIAFCILYGISRYIWIIIGISSLVLTVNLDKTHISFPKPLISSVDQKMKDKLYKLERININKLIVSIFIIFIISTIVLVFGKLILNNKIFHNDVIKNIIANKPRIENVDYKESISNIISKTKEVLSTAKTYYFVILAYIFFIEALAVILHRRYDTKSTIMKLLFVLTYLSVVIFKLNITYYQTILTVLLILIAIVNTSNIYLNREERIKMLVA